MAASEQDFSVLKVCSLSAIFSLTFFLNNLMFAVNNNFNKSEKGTIDIHVCKKKKEKKDMTSDYLLKFKLLGQRR